jgi:hypothetical protein
MVGRSLCWLSFVGATGCGAAVEKRSAHGGVRVVEPHMGERHNRPAGGAGAHPIFVA